MKPKTLLVDKFVPAYQGGASWRRSRRWGGFIDLVKLAILTKSTETPPSFTSFMTPPLDRGGRIFGLLAILVLSFFLTTPTYATSISVDVDQANITISQPDGGKVGYGSQTVNVYSTTSNGFNLTQATVDNDSSLRLVDASAKEGDNILAQAIPSVTGDSQYLSTNTWGYYIYLDSDNYPSFDPNISTNKDGAIWSAIPGKGNPRSIYSLTGSTSNKEDNIAIYYGAKIDKPELLKSGAYQAVMQYTAAANLPVDPTIDTISPNTYEMCGDGCPSEITITGRNLDTVTGVYIDMDKDGTPDASEVCNSLNIESSAKITCKVPELSSSTYAGTYDVIIVADSQDGGTTKKDGFTYAYNKPGKIKTVAYAYGCSDTQCTGDAMVYYDENMIPVIYTGDTTTPKWTSLTWDEAEFGISSGTTKLWFNYYNKQWANAVTVKPEALDKYKNKHVDSVDLNDVLGYWVYIPHFNYEVQRRDATDKVVQAQDFDIRFRFNDGVVYKPKQGCSTLSGSVLTAKDYRTECGIDRTYTYGSMEAGEYGNTTWATHPAFSWCKTANADGTKSDCTDLPGFWVAKFETTGSTKAPTILPNQYHKVANIGDMYDIAKSVGRADCNNVYGNGIETTQNYHNLSNLQSHMMKNSEWGAVAYLSASRFGAGVNNVQINSSKDEGKDGDGNESWSITGCGPYAAGNEDTTYDCLNDSSHQYRSTVGQLSSTTGNVYGVYGMSGGAYEYVMGNRSETFSEAVGNGYMNNPAKPPYVDLYPTSNGLFGTKPSWSASTSDYFYNNDVCTWLTCGGQALHETKMVQSVSLGSQSWGDGFSYFANSQDRWFLGGGGYLGHSYGAGLFYSGADDGYGDNDEGFRVSLSKTR